MIWKAIKIILSEFIVTVGWALTIVGALLLISLKLSSKNDIIEVVVDNLDMSCFSAGCVLIGLSLITIYSIFKIKK